MYDKSKEFFEYLYNKYNTKDFIHTDPIKFPHEYKGNKEFVAFTAAMFAYGNVSAMQRFLHSFFITCGTDPLKLKANPEALKYRFQSTADVSAYCEIMKRIYSEHVNLESLFDCGENEPINAGYNAINTIRSYCDGKLTHGLNFLFTLPGKSASKRLSMYLRWMIRKDEVDFGLWSTFRPKVLSMPLDTHIQRFSEKYGILTNEKGAKALEKVNIFFRNISPTDPAKYDFALTRLGIANGCQYSKTVLCNSCQEREKCLFN